MDDDLHDKLAKAYLDYFDKSEQFEKTPSVRKYYAVHKTIKLLKQLIKQRETEIRQKFLEAKKDRQRKK